MTVETKTSLTDETIAVIQELIEINIDSHNGFKQAVHQLKGTPLQPLFDELSTERAGQAITLQQLILRNDEEPNSEGSVAGRIHRAIMDWRHAFGGGPLAVLKEAERGEEYIKAKYEAVLTQTAGSAVNDLLHQQYAAVKLAHNRVRHLRDQLSAA